MAGRFFLPLDWGWCVGRALRRIQPALLVIAETELWPNLIRSAHRRGARVALVNARLSDRSYRGYRRFRFFFRRVVEQIDAVLAQTPRDAERFRLLGLLAERVTVTGNLKFDGAPMETGALPGILSAALHTAKRGPILVAASTMSGEEPLVLEAWREIRLRHPQALLILAPRHPARFGAVCQVLREKGLTFLHRTALAAGGEELAAQLAAPEILLLDTIGELGGIFQLADLVFMGGSLVPTGGHNLLEPAYWGRAILFGPHMHNFRDIAEMFLEAEAAIEVQNAADLTRQAVGLLEDGQARRALGDQARQVMQRQAGATIRVVEQLDKWLGPDMTC